MQPEIAVNRVGPRSGNGSPSRAGSVFAGLVIRLMVAWPAQRLPDLRRRRALLAAGEDMYWPTIVQAGPLSLQSGRGLVLFKSHNLTARQHLVAQRQHGADRSWTGLSGWPSRSGATPNCWQSILVLARGSATYGQASTIVTAMLP